MPRTLLTLCLWLTIGPSLWAQGNAVYLMRPDGSDLRKVIRVPGYEDHTAPRFSHDGKRLFFAVAETRQSSKLKRKFYVVDLDGKNLKPIDARMMPDWSPDDKQIAYHVNPGDGEPSHVFVQNLNGEAPTEVAQGKSPRWSPDGSRLAFRDDNMLRMLDLLTHEERELLEAPAEDIYSGYTWSRDGKWIAVTFIPEGKDDFELRIVSTIGPEPTSRTRITGKVGGVIGWSHDGKQLVYESEGQIFLADVDGTAPGRAIAGQQGENRHPDWSPDGKWITFVSDRK